MLYNYTIDKMGMNTILNLYLLAFSKDQEKWILHNMDVTTDNFHNE